MVAFGEKVRLYPNSARVLSARKRTARAGAATLGIGFATPQSLCSDLWEIWGGADSLVDGSRRILLMLDELEEQDALPRTLGVARLLAGFVRDAAGTDELAAASAAGVLEQDLDPVELSVLGVVERYLNRLHALGLIEPGEAASLLRDVAAPSRIAFAEPCQAPRALMRLLRDWEAVGAADAPFDGSCEADKFDWERIAPPRAASAFGFAAGPNAVVPLVLAEIGEYVSARRSQDGPVRIAVCARDVFRMFEGVAPTAASMGWSCSLTGSVSFASTRFGRAFETVRLICDEDAHWRMSAVDFAYSPFSGMTRNRAQALDASLRGDRVAAPSTATGVLSAESPTFDLFARCVREASAEAAERIAHMAAQGALGPSCASDAEQAAARELAGFLAAARDAGVSCASAVEAVSSLSVSLSLSSSPTGASAEVRVVSNALLDHLEEERFDLVVISDASDAAFPASQRVSALDTLAGKIGLPAAPSRLGELRYGFNCALRAATDRVFCILPLRNADQSEAYPSFLFDELVAALSIDEEPLADDLFGIPQRFVQSARRFGETELVRGVGRCAARADGAREFPAPERGRLRTVDLMDGVRSVDAGGNRLPVLSPSALEAYAACPYLWFASHCLRLCELDEGFGPREKGSFSHEVLAAFFDELDQTGLGPLQECEPSVRDALLEQVIGRVRARQFGYERDRLVPVNRAEEIEVDRTCDMVRASVERLARLPKEYKVYAHELKISLEDGIDYAGARLVGRVDRVDVCPDTRRFAVLDYKGKIAGYAAGVKEDDEAEDMPLPQKFQALVYAQALRRRFSGYACAAALYLSYNAKDDRSFTAGSADPAAYAAPGFVRETSLVHMNFDAFLDSVEKRVTLLVDRLRSGDIAPNPARKDACGYCPFSACERRLS